MTVPAEVWPVATFLQEEMDARRWWPATVAARCGLPVGRVTAILEGKPLTDDDAARLGIGFGTSPDSWRARDAAFWAGLARELGPGEMTHEEIPTTTDPTAARIERALRNAGRQRIDVRRLDAGSERGGYTYSIGGWIVGCDGFADFPMVIIDDGDVDLVGRFLTPTHERVVALVRAVLSGGWMAEVADLGIEPTTDAIMAECERRKFWAWSVARTTTKDWGYWAAIQTNVINVVSAHADTPTEALALALLRAVEGEGAT